MKTHKPQWAHQPDLALEILQTALQEARHRLPLVCSRAGNNWQVEVQQLAAKCQMLDYVLGRFDPDLDPKGQPDSLEKAMHLTTLEREKAKEKADEKPA